jgi:hypothetical protein
MSEEKKNNWGKFIRRARQSSETAGLVNRIMDDTLRQEPENFLFLSTGEGGVIRGMHYPDSAFVENDFPVIFKTSEPGIVIAAWPQSIIKELLYKCTDSAAEENKNLEKQWMVILEELSEAAARKMENGEINEPF